MISIRTPDEVQRILHVLNEQKFVEWKTANPLPSGSRLFGHREVAVGFSLAVGKEDTRLRFEEDAVDTISPKAAQVFLNLDAALKSELGPNNVVITRIPKGLNP